MKIVNSIICWLNQNPSIINPKLLNHLKWSTSNYHLKALKAKIINKKAMASWMTIKPNKLMSWLSYNILHRLVYVSLSLLLRSSTIPSSKNVSSFVDANNLYDKAIYIQNDIFGVIKKKNKENCNDIIVCRVR